MPGHGEVLRVEGVTVTTGSVAQGVQARVPVTGVQLARQVVQRISHTGQSTSCMYCMALYSLLFWGENVEIKAGDKYGI